MMAEKWTKTSSPDWRWINPKPLLALNHFTVPCSFNCVSLFCLSYLVPSHRLQRKKIGCKCGLAAPSKILKVLQEQQTQIKYHTFGRCCRVKPLGVMLRPIRKDRLHMNRADFGLSAEAACASCRNRSRTEWSWAA